MTLERQAYEKGWAKCAACGCMRRADGTYEIDGDRLCLDVDLCRRLAKERREVMP